MSTRLMYVYLCVPFSIEYWFRCMDLDGDGFISMYEMEHFYEEQVQKMEEMGIDPLPFYDLLCQVLTLFTYIIYYSICLICQWDILF